MINRLETAKNIKEFFDSVDIEASITEPEDHYPCELHVKLENGKWSDHFSLWERYCGELTLEQKLNILDNYKLACECSFSESMSHLKMKSERLKLEAQGKTKKEIDHAIEFWGCD